MDNYPSRLLENAVNELAKLPGIGRKTALRLAMHLLRQNPVDVEMMCNTLNDMAKNIRYCSECNSISDKSICDICNSHNRDKTVICVVEDIRDVMAIENTGQYRGIYHVLGGIISPIDGIGPDDLKIASLVEKVAKGSIKEVIMAFSTTIEGDTTNFYIYKKLKGLNIIVSTIARGISIGDDIEYADQITLGRSIINRTLYENMLADSGKS